MNIQFEFAAVKQKFMFKWLDQKLVFDSASHNYAKCQFADVWTKHRNCFDEYYESPVPLPDVCPQCYIYE